MDLFSYPRTAGYQQTDTSKEAAKDIEKNKAQSLRNRVKELVTQFPKGLTNEEIAAFLKEDVGNIRPRSTELQQQGIFYDTGNRRKNRNNKNVIVWGVKK
jgi:DNA-binding NarL/FixJ family response regulator